ncbi:MAG: universal stress protein [Solirubrobacterales bacterium]|nr:universal stress protein [Solirubrobacterales bacterium]
MDGTEGSAIYEIRVRGISGDSTTSLSPSMIQSTPSGLSRRPSTWPGRSARLTILTAVPHPPATASYAGLSPSALEADAESEAILRRAKEMVPGDVPVTTILTRAAVRDALDEQVETGRFDLLVMGSRGRGSVRSTLLGSVSHHLLNHSAIPLLIVHAMAPSDRRERESGVLADAV